MLGAFAASAQSPSPIKWRTTVKMLDDRDGILTIRAVIEKGWHLYGTKLPEGGPKPTTFDFAESRGVKFIGAFEPNAKPIEKEDAVFGTKLSWWAKNVTFTRKFRLSGDIKDAVISGKITFMGCNDETCMPPRTETVTLKLKK